MSKAINDKKNIQHVFIIGAKSIGQYGGYETFVDRLMEEHENEPAIQYHVACKANGEGCMDEEKLSNITNIKRDENGRVREFRYRGAHVFKLPCPDIGPAVAIYYDRAAVLYSLQYCRKYHIEHPIFYILTCRIGICIKGLVRQIKELGGKFFLNPDGHEWKRSKWNKAVRAYWKWSEKKMVKCADLIICDSLNIEKYIKKEYGSTNTTYISYGADVEKSELADDDPMLTGWLQKWDIDIGQYYLVVGRFVPENNYETIIREYMASHSEKDLVLIMNENEKLLQRLEDALHWKSNAGIRFVGTVYDKVLLKKIRECAYGYIHGHEVGGTNPSLLESLGTTSVNLLLDVGFNREVAADAALYWNKDRGSLSSLIRQVDAMDKETRYVLDQKAKKRILDAYSWNYIGKSYKTVLLGNPDC